MNSASSNDLLFNWDNNGGNDPAWVIFDLGQTTALDQVVIFNQNEYKDCRRCIGGADLLYAPTGVVSVWATSVEARWEVTSQAAHKECPNPKREVIDVYVGASQYWKLSLPKAVWTGGEMAYYGLMEVEFYGQYGPRHSTAPGYHRFPHVASRPLRVSLLLSQDQGDET